VLDTLMSSLAALLSFQHLFYMLIGVSVGLVIGVIPGLGGIAGLSLLMPFLYGMDEISALAMLIGLVAVGLRRYAPQWLEKLQADRGERRLKVTETLVLDPARRLVLVQIDDEERLLLLGEGKELTGPTTLRRVPPRAAMDPEV